jgi:hypothetical protein
LGQQQPGDRVISQPCANAGEVHYGLDAQPGELGPGTNARAQKDRWRPDRTGGQGDAPSPDLFRVAFACDLHPNRSVAVDQHPVDQAVRKDGEVRSLPSRQQIGDRRRYTQAVPPVLGERAHPRCFRVVVVGDLGEAETAAHLEERTLDRDQLIEPPPADRDRAAAAPMQRARPLRVIPQPSKGRQHLRPAPLIIAQRRPPVAVGRHAAQRDRGIDSRGPADHPAARIGDDPAGDSLGGQPPVMGPQRHAPAVLQVLGG